MALLQSWLRTRSHSEASRTRVKANGTIASGVEEHPARVCERCGGPNPAYALNCQWCGATLIHLPLPGEISPPTAEREYSSVETDSEFSSDPSPNRTRLAALAAVFLLVVIVLAVFASQSQSSASQTPVSSGPSYSVNVTIVELRSLDNACGLNGTTEPGFHGVTSAASGQTWRVTAPPDGCTITSVSAVTGGFEAFLNSIGGQSIPGGQTVGVGVSYFMTGLSGPYTGPLVLSLAS